MTPDKIYVKEFDGEVSKMWSSERSTKTLANVQHEYIRKGALLDKLNFALKLRGDDNHNSNNDGIQTIKAIINYIESL